MPPPVRRIAVDREPSVVAPAAAPNGAAGPPRDRGSATAAPCAPQRAAARSRSVRERMRIESVWLAYGENWVVRDVSLPVRQGEVLALIGASGSGKTTLLRSLNRLTEITAGAARAGRITLDGQEIHELEVNALRRRVSMVFQQPNPFPMSIFDNVAYALAERAPGAALAAPRRSAELEHAVERRAAPGRAVRGGRRTTSTARRCGSPAASSSGCASRARSPPSPRCCCWTSPARRSTRSPRRRSRS